MRPSTAAILILSSHALVASPRPGAAPLRVGTAKQLFIDDRFVASSRGVTLALNLPEQPPGSVLPKDRPWERGRIGGYAHVFEHQGLYRLYYNTFDVSFETRYLCLALSADGVHWTKPDVGTVEYAGSRRNNIVAIGVLGEVFVDPFAAPERRFKLLSNIQAPDPRWEPSVGGDREHLYLFVSGDGAVWRREPGSVLPFYFGAPTSVFWDGAISKWAVFPRAYLPDSRVRVYARTTVDRDALARPYPYTANPARLPGKGTAAGLSDELPVVLKPDERDPPGMQIYTLGAVKYPFAADAHVAFPSMWYSRRPDWATGKADPEASDTLEVQLALSRDGVAWRRPFRHAVIRRGPTGSGLEGQIYSSGMVRHGDRLLVYYCGLGSRHLTGDPKSDWNPVIGRVVFRLDGFVSADAAYEGGELTTPPLVFEGNRLELNATTGGGGFVRVEVLDAQGRVHPGFGLAEADRVDGDSVAHRVTWRGRTDLGALGRAPIRLRFVMRDARLYAFQFVP